MHQRFLSRAVLATLAAVAAGCSDAEQVGSVEQPVLGGTPAGAERDAVVFVTSEVAVFGGAPIAKRASGTLVAPNLLLTALHVVSRNPTDVPFTCDADGNEVSGTMGSLLGPPVSPERVAIYAGATPANEPVARGQRILSTGSRTVCENDLAFVVLDRAVDLPTLPIHHGDRPAVGDGVTAVGFGVAPTISDPERSQRELTVTAVGQWIRTFTVSVGPCEGDSGGPAISSSGEVVGVFSSVAVDCTASDSSPKYTDLSYFSSLTQRAFDAAEAGSPWPSAGAAGAASEPAGQAGEASGGDAPHEDGGCSCRAIGAERPHPMSSWLPLTAGLLGWTAWKRLRRAELHESRNKLRDSCNRG